MLITEIVPAPSLQQELFVIAEPTTMKTVAATARLLTWQRECEENRLLLAAYITMWFRRYGIPEGFFTSFRHISKRLLPALEQADLHFTCAELRDGLGLGENLPPEDFWTEEVLAIVLEVIRVSPQFILVELGVLPAKCFERKALRTEHGDCVYEILDRFAYYDAGKRKWLQHKGSLRLFGTFVQERLFERGDQRKFADVFGRLEGISTIVPAGTRHSSAVISLSRLLTGKSGTWNVTTLQTLATFYRTTPEEIAEAYEVWAEVCTTQQRLN